MDGIKRIFVVGHVAAGKAVLAEAIANHLNWRFVDADSGLEFYMGSTIGETFGESSANDFLNCQKKILNKLCQQENIVVATDGTVGHALAKMSLETEFVVHLQVSTNVQLERLNDRHPILLPSNKLEAFLQTLHQERDAVFEELANVSTSSDDGEINTHVKKVMQAFNAP